jgi:hypothetical protein
MVDPVLTTVIQGYSNATMIADALFPHVSVSKIKGKIPVFGREAFVVRDTYRAIRANSNRIPPSNLDLITFETLERDVETALDYLEEEETPDFLRLEQKVARELYDILLLGKEKEAADYVQNTSNFDSSLRTILNSSGAWDDYTLTSVDPIALIKDCAATLRAKIARYPNTLVMGDATYQALIQHPKVIERVKYAGLSNVNTKIIAELTDIPNIHIGMAVHTTDGTTFSDIWSDNVILAYSDKHDRNLRSEYNPSYGYTFQREGKPEIDSYTENGGKMKVIRATDNYCIKVTASDAAYLISNTNL